jgi:hypothetical protein
MAPLVAEVLDLRAQLATPMNLRIPMSDGRVLLVSDAGGDRYIVSRGAEVIGMFYGPHMPDVLGEAAGLHDDEREALATAIGEARAARAAKRAAFDELIAQLRAGTHRDDPVARKLLADLDEEAAADRRARAALANRGRSGRRRGSPRTTMTAAVGICVLVALALVAFGECRR